MLSQVPYVDAPRDRLNKPLRVRVQNSVGGAVVEIAVQHDLGDVFFFRDEQGGDKFVRCI
jgi:hypothetical protein